MPRVIIRFDENGESTFYVEGGDVEVYIVDERAPDDRVYQWSDRNTAAEMDAILGDEVIGHRFDGSWAAHKLGQRAN